jgi:hypothetical protein
VGDEGPTTALLMGLSKHIYKVKLIGKYRCVIHLRVCAFIFYAYKVFHLIQKEYETFVFFPAEENEFSCLRVVFLAFSLLKKKAEYGL